MYCWVYDRIIVKCGQRAHACVHACRFEVHYLRITPSLGNILLPVVLSFWHNTCPAQVLQQLFWASSCLHILREAQEVAKAILPCTLGLAAPNRHVTEVRCGVGSVCLLAKVLILMDQTEKWLGDIRGTSSQPPQEPSSLKLVGSQSQPEPPENSSVGPMGSG